MITGAGHKAQPYLLQHRLALQSLQIFQMGMEQRAVQQLYFKQPFNDVANRAVIRKTHSFCGADEVTQAVRAQETRSNTL